LLETTHLLMVFKFRLRNINVSKMEILLDKASSSAIRNLPDPPWIAHRWSTDIGWSV